MTAAMTPEIKRIKAARTKNLAAARRSLGLIAEAIEKHRVVLHAGEIPGDSLPAASFGKYEQALDRLRLLGSLIGGGAETEPEPEPEEAAVNGHVPGAAEVGLLVGVVRAYGLVPESADPGSPLGQLTSFAFPDGNLPPYGTMGRLASAQPGTGGATT